MKQSFILALLFYSLGSTGQSYQLQEYDIAPGDFSSRPHNLYIYNGKVHFFATDSLQGKALWSVAQTGQPTLVGDINPSTFTFPIGNTNQQLMATVNNKLYFRTEHINYGEELWVYDGVNNPVLIKDIVPGTMSSTPTFLTQLNNKLYFAASDSTTTSGLEIFEFNESTGDVIKRSNILQAKLYSAINQVSMYDGRLVFSAANDLTGSEVFLYDPKVKISWLLADIAPGNLDAHPIGYTSLNGKLYFIATDGTKGRQLYLYDGIYTPKRVEILDSLGITPLNSANSIGAYNGKLYFVAKLSANQYNLYAYNPSDNSLSEIRAENETFTSPPAYFCFFHGNLFFSAIGSVSGNQVWVYNGLSNTKHITQFTDINSYPAELTVLKDNIFFSAASANGRELYKLTESPASVQSIKFDEITEAYPNPAKDIAYLPIDPQENQTLEILLTDVNGRMVYNSGKILYSASKHTIKIPMHNIPTGMYVYSVRSKDGTILNTGKLQKL